MFHSPGRPIHVSYIYFSGQAHILKTHECHQKRFDRQRQIFFLFLHQEMSTHANYTIHQWYICLCTYNHIKHIRISSKNILKHGILMTRSRGTTYDIYLSYVVFGWNFHRAPHVVVVVVLWTMTEQNTGTSPSNGQKEIRVWVFSSFPILMTIIAPCECLYVNTTPYVRQKQFTYTRFSSHTHIHTHIHTSVQQQSHVSDW